MTTDKWTCDQCDWQGSQHQMLHSYNPFSPEEEIYGCPECKGVACFTQACEEPDCWAEATAGTPYGDKQYKRHCHRHGPKE